jgi:signal transduction histidine kinase
VRDRGTGPARDGPLAADRSPQAGEHIGLAVMRERMAAIGGRLELSSRRRRGFEVRAVAALGAQ